MFDRKALYICIINVREVPINEDNDRSNIFYTSYISIKERYINIIKIAIFFKKEFIWIYYYECMNSMDVSLYYFSFSTA